jgi:mono/diheme cytochrome c family protein
MSWLDPKLFLSLLAAASVALTASVASPGPAAVDKLAFHYDRERSGWNDRESLLTPDAVASDAFGELWQSPQLDGFGDVPARLYAAPLYVNSVAFTEGPHRGRRLAAVYAVTSTGYAYAINATASATPAPGTILWRTRLTAKPCEDGRSGNFSTPVIDRAAHRLYVTSCDAERHWQVHALDIRTGRSLSGWPVTLDAAALNRPGINRNGPHLFSDSRSIIQRGALNLSPDNERLYIAIGPDSTGWIVAVDTKRAEVATAFSSTARTEEDQGGMWASGGPSVDDLGRVHIATGAKFLARARKGVAGIFPDSEKNWGQSVLQLRDDREKGFVLTGTYSPFNYCQAAAADIDLGSSGTILIDLPAGASATRHLLIVGGKQGNMYLLDRDHLPGDLIKRRACSTDPNTDGSLLAPEPQPHFGLPGPINLFGPYSDYVSMLDQAKSRSTPAYFRDPEGQIHIFATGSAKTGDDFSASAPPGLARLALVAAPGRPAYLRVGGFDMTQTFGNPSSPIVSSSGGTDAIVWVLDTNAPRTASLYGDDAPKPVLYAFEARSLKLLWKSAPGELFTSGKYNEPSVINGLVLVGTDRIQAFGLRKARGPTGARRSAGAPSSDAVPAAPRATVEAGAGAPTIAEGRRIFEARCAACHGSGQPGTPSRADLARLTQARIIEALAHGVMRPMAGSLSPSQYGSVAKFLTETQP